MARKKGNPPRPKAAYCQLTLQSLVRRAGEGSADARENLGRFLSLHPEARDTIAELDDLADRAVAEWVEAAAEGNPDSEFSIIDDASIDLPNVKPVVFDTAQAS